MYRILFSVIFFIGLFWNIVTGQAQKQILPEDLAPISGISNPQISPDGQWILFEEQVALTVKDPSEINKEIWLVPADGSTPPRKFAFGPKQEYRPQWSPDGKYVAFLSNRENPEIFQLYILHRNGDEAHKITSLKQGIIDFKWLPDSKTIAFTAPESASSKKENQLQTHSDARLVGKSFRRVRLFELNLQSKNITPISKSDENVIAFDYSHQGNRIALNVSDSPDEDNVAFHSRLVIMNRDGSNRTVIKGTDQGFDMGRCWKTSYWSPDDRQILYFVHAASSYLPAILSVKNFKARLLAKNYQGTIWYMNWNPATGEIIVVTQQGVQGLIGKLDPKSGTVTPIRKIGTPYCEVQIFSISPDGQYITFHNATYRHPDDIYIMKSDGSDFKRLTNMNLFTEKLKTVPPEIIHWKSKDGLTIEGLLFKPTDYDPSRRYPTVVDIHGGPTWAWWNGWLAGWHEWGQLLANYGFVVLMPNPRGSNGYGFEFSKANFNDWGGGDFDDIMSGIDYLIRQGIADSSRLGIGGWSYGGFMTAWAITQTNRFKAAVMGAAVTDLITMHNTCGRPEEFNLFFGGNPIDREEIYRAHSPITFVRNVSTPTLILHGESDTVVPISQSYEYYQSLKDLDVITEFVSYPREGHGIDEQAHQIDLMYRLIDWFNRYLKEKQE